MNPQTRKDTIRAIELQLFEDCRDHLALGLPLDAAFLEEPTRQALVELKHRLLALDWREPVAPRR